MLRHRVSLLPVFTIAFCSATMIVVLIGVWRMRAGTLPAHELDALRLVHRKILEDYIAERDPSELIYDAIDGMVSKLDRYSRFVPPDEVREFEGDEISGTYEGIGIVPVLERMPFTVRWPFPGGPADRAGVRVGDQILAVGGIEIDSYGKALDLLLGPAGSTAHLTVRRPSAERTGAAAETLEIEVERDSVRKPSVKWTRLLTPEHQAPADQAPIGYVYVGEFQQHMVEAFDEALAQLESEASTQLAGLVIDMRSNPGGLLTEAIELANRFVASGRIVSLKNRDGDVLDLHEARAELCDHPDLPLAVLVDRNSASAAEVFAGAMQDHDRAHIIGERTFGKGVVQQIYTWPNHEFRLKLTSSHYYTPNGRSLARELRREDRDGQEPGGIDPDVQIAQTVVQIRTIRSSLKRHEPPRRYTDAITALAGQLEFEFARPPDPESDPVLAGALNALRAPPADPPEVK